MKCSKAMKEFLELDQGERASPELSRHLTICPACAQEAAKLSVFFEALRNGEEKLEAAGLETSGLAAAVLSEIENRERTKSLAAAQEVSLRDWIVPGVVILGGITLVPFSSFLPALRGLSGGTLELAIPLSLGIAITVYATLFIGTNVSTFRRLLRMENLGFRD